MQVLFFVADDENGRTASDVAAHLGITVPTSHHILNTLVDEGVVTKDRSRRYRLGPKVGVLSDAFLRDTSPPPYLMEPLRRLATATEETAYICAWRNTWRDTGAEVMASIEGAHSVRVAGLKPGFQANPHARAAGKALLAHLDESALDGYLATHKLEKLTSNTITDEKILRAELAKIRTRGYALDFEEFAEDLCCVAAPVVHDGNSGRCLLALGPGL